MRGEGIRGRFDGFVNIRVHEHRSAEAVGGACRSQLEVLDVARFLQHGEIDRNGGKAVRFLAWRPKGIVNLNLGERNRAEVWQRAGRSVPRKT